MKNQLAGLRNSAAMPENMKNAGAVASTEVEGSGAVMASSSYCPHDVKRDQY